MRRSAVSETLRLSLHNAQNNVELKDQPTTTHGPSPAASATQASARKAGGAAKPASHALTVRRDTPSAWAACCWV